LLKYLKIKLDRFENTIILLDHQNNYVENSQARQQYCKNFGILATNLRSVLHNYFNSPTKLFSDLYLAKFLDILAKSFFLCGYKSISCVIYFKIKILSSCNGNKIK